MGTAADVSNLIVQSEAQEQQARSRRIDIAYLRYGGMFDAPLKRTELDPGAKDNILVNKARWTVATSAFYLFGIGEVGFEVVVGTNQPSKADPESDSEEEIWLEKVWDANEKGSLLLESAMAGGVAGDCFFRLVEPDEQCDTGEYPQINALDPQYVTAVWDPSNYKKVIQYKIQFTGVDSYNFAKPVAVTYRTLITRNDDGTWQITDQESIANDPRFTTTSDRVWPWPFCPIFHCKNLPAPNQFYGTSDLENDVLRLNDAINFTMSTINRILRAHGHPIQYVAGQESGKIDRGVGNMLFLPNPDATIGSVEMLSDLSSAQAHLQELQEAYHQLTNIPEVVSGKFENVGQLSGLALQILYGPLMMLTETKRTLYGTMLRRMNMALLQMGGFSTVTDVQIQWPNILPSDPAAEANTAIAKKSVGVSTDTVLTEMGYNPVDEANKRKAEAASVADLAMQRFDRGDDDNQQQDDQDGGGNTGDGNQGGDNGSGQGGYAGAA